MRRAVITGLSLPRRAGMDRQRMHAAGELRGERRIDHAMALDPALSLEGLRHNIDPEMGLSARPMARMTLMLVGFIDHPQALRRESRGQLFRDDLSCTSRI